MVYRENILCPVGENVYAAVVAGGGGSSALRSSGFIVLLKASISHIFCLAVLSIILSGVLEITTITVEPSISPSVLSGLLFMFLMIWHYKNAYKYIFLLYWNVW